MKINREKHRRKLQKKNVTPQTELTHYIMHKARCKKYKPPIEECVFPCTQTMQWNFLQLKIKDIILHGL